MVDDSAVKPQSEEKVKTESPEEPVIKKIDKKYKKYGLETILIHPPEWEFEKNSETILHALKKRSITFPVVVDKHKKIIKKLGIDFWPTQIVMDDGKILYRHVGEGDYKKLENTKICYIGDGNNMTNSWIEAALTLGLTLNIACPKGYEPDSLLLEKIKKHSHILFTHDPEEAIKNADVINTDTWFSMGQEISETKKESFKPFQINTCLLKQAHPQAIVLHCLPAHRGEEITDEVIDGPQSMVFEQAANRLYTQMALLEYLVGKKRRMK